MSSQGSVPDLREGGKSPSASLESGRHGATMITCVLIFPLKLYFEIIIDSKEVAKIVQSFWRVATESIKPPQEPELSYPLLFHFPLQPIKTLQTVKKTNKTKQNSTERSHVSFTHRWSFCLLRNLGPVPWRMDHTSPQNPIIAKPGAILFFLRGKIHVTLTQLFKVWHLVY